MKSKKSRYVAMILVLLAMMLGGAALVGQIVEALVGLGIGLVVVAVIHYGILWAERGVK